MNTRISQTLAAIPLLLFPLLCFSQSAQLADSLHRRGMNFYEGGQYRQAEFYLREAFHLYEKNAKQSTWLTSGIDYAEILVDRSKYDKALKLFIRLQKTDAAQNDIKVQARIENDLGWTYSQIGKNTKALQHLTRALPLAEESQDTLRLGYIYNNIGSVYYGQGDYKKSLEYREKSLYYKQKTGNKNSIGISVGNIGFMYEKLLLYDKALKNYNKSLGLFEEAGNVNLLAITHADIGRLYKKLGEYNQALVYYQNSLEYRKKAGNPDGTATTLNNIGILYNQLGHPDRALEYYRESLEVKKGFADPNSMALSYKNIANRLWDLGRNEEATHHYKRALELRRQGGNAIQTASSLLDLCRIELAKGNVESASDYLQQAANQANSTEGKPVQLRINMQKGNIFWARNNISKALNAYKAGYEVAKQMSDSDQLWPLHKMARTYDRLDSPKALSTGRKVIAIIEKERSQTGSLSKFKAGYFKQHVDFYIEMASWLLKYNQDAAGAYHLVELAKARALTDELASAAKRIDETLPEKERLKRAQHISDLSALYTSLDKITSPKQKAEIKKKIRTKELAYASFENSLQQSYPQYKHLKSPDPISLDKVQTMLDEETALLEYAITKSGLMLTFLVTNNDVQTKQFSINNDGGATDSSSHLSASVMKFRRGIISRASKDSLRKLSTPIYNQLIAPFEEDLESFENLIIVPDGFLAYLPFDALNIEDNYLVSQYNIKYAPSMTGFSLITKPNSTVKNNILTIANASSYSSRKDTPLLPTANLEVETVSELFNSRTILKDADVTEENVKKHIQQKHSIVHIAAHSVIDEKNSSQSGIILYPSNSNGIGNDGYLRNNEIYQLNIPGDMVVLSACKSGIGQMINGEGMLGLQRAFFNAGASSVIVSLWDVYDRSTTHFMQLFYKSLINAPRNKSWSDSWQSLLRWAGWDESVPFGHTASSMRQAKLAMLNHPRYHHPVYWAPFISVGR